MHQTRLLSVAALITLCLVPSIAEAATNTFTVYAYGSGNILRQIFVGMKGFVDDSAYRMMIFVLMLLMMIFALTKGYLFQRPSAVPIVGLLLAGVALNLLLFSSVARMPIHIEDPVHGEDYLIDDMPIALVAPAALTSEMSRYMVRAVETFYIGPAIPDNIKMSNTNTYDFAGKIMNALKNISVSDPMVKATFNSYMHECVVPEMYQGRINLKKLLFTPPDQFWGALKSNNLARRSLCYDYCNDADPGDTCSSSICPSPMAGTGTYAADWRAGVSAPCPQQHEKLESRITALIGATAFNELGNTLLRDTTVLDGVVNSTVTQITGVTGGTGTEHFVRAGMMNMFRESSANVIANGGQPGLIQVLGTEQAKAVQRTNWMVAASVFGESVAYLWAALQAFIFAIFPIAVVLFLFPGVGMRAVGAYFSLMAWISLWMPFLSIIDYLSMSWLTEDIRQLSMVPLSYSALIPMSDAGANMQAITAFLGTMVPVLTYGMVRSGEFALTEIAQNASAPRSSEKAADQIASKSYSYGSISANNVGMNKFDSTTSMSTGYDAVSSKSGTGALNWMTPRSIATTTAAGAPDTVLGQSASSADTSNTGALSMQNGEAYVIDNSSASSISDAGKQTLSRMTGSDHARSALETSGNELRTQLQNQLSSGVEYGRNASNALSASTGISNAGQLTTKGAVVAGAITAMIGAEGLGEFRAKGDEQFGKRLKEQYGSVAAGLQAMGVGGAAVNDEKSAVAYLSALNQRGMALQASKPGLSSDDAGAAVTAQELAKNTDADLDALAQKDATGKSLLSQGLRDQIGEFKGAAKATGAVVGGVADGAAATLLSYISRNKAIGNFATFDGAIQSGGEGKATNSADLRTSGGTSASDSTNHGKLFSMGDGYQESNQRVRRSAEDLRSSVERVVSNTQGVKVTDSVDSRKSVVATETTSAKDSAGISANFPIGRTDAMVKGSAWQEQAMRSQNPEALLAAAKKKVDGLTNNTEQYHRNLQDRTAAANDKSPAPAAIPQLGGDAGGRVAAAQAAGVRTNPQDEPVDPGKPAPGRSAFDSSQYANAAMADHARQMASFLETHGDQLRAMSEPGQQASSYGVAMSMLGAKATGVSGAVDAASAAAGATAAQLAKGGTVQRALDQAYKGLTELPMIGKGGGFFKINDAATNADFKMVPGSDGRAPVVLSGERKNFGQFLQSDKASLVGVNPEEYRSNQDGSAMTTRQAEDKYNATMNLRITEEERKFGR